MQSINWILSQYVVHNSLQISYSYSSGPGGQHVNKTKSKVEIRFHVPSASWIPDEAHRITKDQYFVISSDRTRKQILNQADCMERIRRMVRECLNATKKPIVDPDTLEAIVARNENRLREKKIVSFTKQQRQKPTVHDFQSE
ncbi:unnamed protein product [Echinostoma caproni]|uniref:Large ribosomal subunit protein mL62 n=1 Tax=Echinostoma caproni TaxID=27848 RepID=A0A183A2E5_9TREM|nr:unnamed protein product [Echinostoma caproni]